MSKPNKSIEVETRFASWDGDGTATLTYNGNHITLPVEEAEEMLQKAITEIREERTNLAWNR